MTEPRNRPDEYDYNHAAPQPLEDSPALDESQLMDAPQSGAEEPPLIQVPGRHRREDLQLDETASEADTSTLISTEEVEAALNTPDYAPLSESGAAAAGVEPAQDATIATDPALLPDFERPTARRLINSDADPLTAADASEFVAQAYREHLRTQVAFALVLGGPAALFCTLWWPIGMPNGVSFVEHRPVLAISIGLVAALVLIALGLIVHFRDGKRPHILRRVEQGTLVPSDESRAFAEQHWNQHAGRARLLTVGAVIIALLSLSALIWGALQAADGSIPGLFLGIALACLLGTAAFLCYYSVFALKRARRVLSA